MRSLVYKIFIHSYIPWFSESRRTKDKDKQLALVLHVSALVHVSSLCVLSIPRPVQQKTHIYHIDKESFDVGPLYALSGPTFGWRNICIDRKDIEKLRVCFECASLGFPVLWLYIHISDMDT